MSSLSITCSKYSETRERLVRAHIRLAGFLILENDKVVIDCIRL
jgi:hypothetical protein